MNYPAASSGVSKFHRFGESQAQQAAGNMTPRDSKFPSANVRGQHIEKGNAFIWKPIAMSADERIQFSWGGPVLVSDRGADSLFKRKHGLVSLL